MSLINEKNWYIPYHVNLWCAIGYNFKLKGLTTGVTTSHESMKHMENDEYLILFKHHFPCRSPVGFIHQHPIKWIHQCIFLQRDITCHQS